MKPGRRSVSSLLYRLCVRGPGSDEAWRPSGLVLARIGEERSGMRAEDVRTQGHGDVQYRSHTG